MCLSTVFENPKPTDSRATWGLETLVRITFDKELRSTPRGEDERKKRESNTQNFTCRVLFIFEPTMGIKLNET